MTMKRKTLLKIIGSVGALFIAFMLTRAYLAARDAGLISRNDYDTTAPNIPKMMRPSVLVFHKTNGFIHEEGIPAANTMLVQIAAEQGWDVFVTDNGATHSPEILEQFDIVVWNNVTGDVLTHEQRAAMRQWFLKGGGWIGLHASGGNFSYKWPWFVDTLIGTEFVGHTLNPQFQDADVLVANPQGALTNHLPERWRIENEEWYAFETNPREKGYEILLTLDEASYVTNGENWMGLDDQMDGEHPIAWRHEVSDGRIFYSGIGHQSATYRLPEYREFVRRGMVWAAGVN